MTRCAAADALLSLSVMEWKMAEDENGQLKSFKMPARVTQSRSLHDMTRHYVQNNAWHTVVSVVKISAKVSCLVKFSISEIETVNCPTSEN
jgi:hypothetical protein